MAKPIILPRWATSLADPSDIVEPMSGKKDIGWQDAELPPHSYMNWLFNVLYLWAVYLDGLTGEALTWTAAHIFSNTVTFNGAITINAGATFNGVDHTGGTNGGIAVTGLGGDTQSGTGGAGGAFVGGLGTTGTGGVGVSGAGGWAQTGGIGAYALGGQGTSGNGGLGASIIGGNSTTGGNGGKAAVFQGGDASFGFGGNGIESTGGGGDGQGGHGGVFTGAFDTSSPGAGIVTQGGQDGGGDYYLAIDAVHGNILIRDGFLNVSDGILLTAGDMEIQAGGLFVSDDLEVGDDLLVGGDMTSTAGNLTLSSGHVSASLAGSVLVQDAMTNMTLVNGWANAGGSSQVAAYWRDSLGVVHLTGLLVTTSSTNILLFTLPAGYRPAATEFFDVYDTVGALEPGKVSVLADGRIQCVVTVVASGQITLGGISFKAV